MENKPIFVKIDEYHDIRKILDLVKEKIAESKTMIEGIERLRHEEAAEIQLWKKEIEEVEQRTEFIHRSLFGD